MKYSVYISYLDSSKYIAIEVKKRLKFFNINAFVSEVDLKLGDIWSDTISKIINDCEYFVCIITENSLLTDYQLFELENARRRNIPILFALNSGLKFNFVNSIYSLTNNIYFDYGEEEYAIAVITYNLITLNKSKLHQYQNYFSNIINKFSKNINFNEYITLFSDVSNFFEEPPIIQKRDFSETKSQLKHINETITLLKDQIDNISQEIESSERKQIIEELDEIKSFVAVSEELEKAPLRIFIAFSVKDKIRAQNLYKKLKKIGYTPWIYTINGKGGAYWEDEIYRQMEDSDFCIGCFSSRINKRSYLHKEIRRALIINTKQASDSRYLIPIKLEKCTIPNISVEGIKLSDLHYIEYYKRDGFSKLLKALV